MSDFKNVLKAGFLVTASLLATGCGDDNKDKANSNSNNNGTNNNGTPNGDGKDNSGSSTVTSPSAVRTFTLNVGDVLNKLRSSTKYEVSSYPDRVEGAKDGLGEDYDILANLSTKAQKLGVDSPASLKNVSAAIVDLTNYTSIGKESFSFKGSAEAVKPREVGVISAEGLLSKEARSVLKTKVEGSLSSDVLILRNCVLNAGAANATLTSKYTYVGIDAAIGYANPRQNAKGENVPVPLSVHSMPVADEVAKLSAGPVPATAKTTAAKQSTATKTTKVDSKDAEVQKKAVTKPATVAVKPETEGTLTLETKVVNKGVAETLTAAGLDIHGVQATVDIGGRAHMLNSSNTVVTAISEIQPELVHIPELEKSSTTVAKTTPTTAAAAKTATAATKKLSAGTTPAPAAKKTQATPTTVAAKAAATASKPTTNQAVVKQADGTHKFLFQIKEGGLYPEIETWNVGAGTEYAVISHHGLVVHKLNLNDNLGLRVLAEEHTFTKLEGATIASLGSGQGLFNALEKDHSLSIETSAAEVVGKADDKADDKAEQYAHFDSHTQFPLWVMSATVAANKKVVLSGIDLAKAGVLVEGVHVMPLAKDFTNKLPESASAANEKIALALNGVADASLEVGSWKVVGNGFFDRVLVIDVVKKTAQKLSAGILDRVLMSAKAQGGHSVASSQLDAVVAKLDPTNLVSASFANVASGRANQAAQFATLARGSNVATSEKLGAVEQYSVAFNHGGIQFGLTYNLDGGNAFTTKSGTTLFGANVATDVLGLKAIVSAEAAVDAGKNAFANAAVASYNAGLTLAKAYNTEGLSVVPMAGFGVSSNALNGYSAVVPMAAGSLGLSMNDVSFSAATFHAGVNVALDDVVENASGVNASLTVGVAGYLASTANAKLSTNEGVSTNIAFEGSSATPYAQFNLGLASGEKLNALISTGSVAVNFGFDR